MSDSLLQIERQYINEEMYSRHHIDKKIRQEIEKDLMPYVDKGVDLLNIYINQEYSYASKNERVAQLKELDLKELVIAIFTGILYLKPGKPELFTSISASLAGRVGFSDKRDAIATMAEMLAVLADVEIYDVVRAGKNSLAVVNKVALEDELQKYIDHSAYLPPMVCKPLKLKNNFSSGYLTHKDSLILGKGNHHNEDICLDVLNIINSVPLQLSVEFLSTVEEEPSFEIKDQDQLDQWLTFKKQSHHFYKLMVSQGNKIYLTHKYDKRGRIYSQGYHITTQGTSYKKAMLELANEELIEGME